ncbi:hypothetical protein [Kitasatospora kifunensis]|uniref:Aminoglycoside phosphotransferase domain-containing protein n=1 Tax=Kitasatospora kifunensis TaxID=58351 RepID=A0A7W7QXN4_KITKI|nr:hypothetical protein [Kitasatospora kifunensis]MBB4921711.1 hypothetical protein [Kitasatospora kifunensis]
MDQILHAASALLGRQLTDPVDLGGSPRSSVLRCRTAEGGTVIVKAFTAEAESRRAFTAEAAGLALDLGGPELLAVDRDFPLLVMADLGAAPTLADLLLGTDPKAAERGLLEWARGLGRLAAAGATRRAEFAELWARYDQGLPSWGEEPWIAQNAAELPAVLAAAGVEAAPGLAEELARIGTAGGERYPGFTPGDTCPDNNLLTAEGLRLIDFEAACFQSVFLTAAYCRMPFASCWCVFRPPAALAAEVERVYRAEVLASYPELAEEACWQRGMAEAVAVWTVELTVRLLPRALPEDAPMHRTRRPVPTRRQLLAHRWTLATALPGLPALGETMERLLTTVAAGWNVAPLPGYPAFEAERVCQ